MAALVGAACSGKSVRHGQDSVGDDDDDPSPGGATPNGGAVSNGGAGGVGTGGLVSRGGADPSGGEAGGGGTSGTGSATGGTAGTECGPADYDDGWGPNECWDGRACRKELENSDCPPTYDEAVLSSHVEGVNCAGVTTESFVYVRQTYAELICVYDFDGYLVGFEFADDNDEHCGERTEMVVGGVALPRTFTFVDIHQYHGCSLSSRFTAQSRSQLFQGLFPALLTAGSTCAPASDECRSALLMLVCGDEFGEANCGACETHADCEEEYPYFGSDTVFCDGGACRFNAAPVGWCNEGMAAPQCRTAAASYVCDLGACSVCLTGQECELATEGARGVCTDAGTCVTE